MYTCHYFISMPAKRLMLNHENGLTNLKMRLFCPLHYEKKICTDNYLFEVKLSLNKNWLYSMLTIVYIAFAAGSPSDFMPLVNLGGRFQFLTNGTLWVESALPYDEGHYMCKAENGVGSPLTKTIFVAINGEYLHSFSLEICEISYSFRIT